MSRPKVFVGTACYRTMEPATAASMVDVAWNGDADMAEIVGLSLPQGYGAVRNAEGLVRAAQQAGADLLLYHDADMRYDAADVTSHVATWLRLGPKSLVGAVYPASSGASYVGRLAGLPACRANAEPDPFGLFTKEDTIRPYVGEALEAESLGFGFVAIPMEFLLGLRASRGYAFAEKALGEVLDTPDTRMCEDARAAGYRLVANLAARPKHLVREWRGL